MENKTQVAKMKNVIESLERKIDKDLKKLYGLTKQYAKIFQPGAYWKPTFYRQRIDRISRNFR